MPGTLQIWRNQAAVELDPLPGSVTHLQDLDRNLPQYCPDRPFWKIAVAYDSTFAFNALRVILCQEFIHFSLNGHDKKLLRTLLEQIAQCIFRWCFESNNITISDAVYLIC